MTKTVYNRQYYRANKKRLVKQAMKWAKENPEKRAVYMHNNYIKNRVAYRLRKDSWVKNHPEWRSFNAARTRCTNPNQPGWKNYGGRGIQFRFTSYVQFYNELGPKPTLKHTLDRINPNGHYEPGNVRWATRFEQQHNKRKPSCVECGETTRVLYGEVCCVCWFERQVHA